MKPDDKEELMESLKATIIVMIKADQAASQTVNQTTGSNKENNNQR